MEQTVLGITIDGRRVIFSALRNTTDGIEDITGTCKPIKLEDDMQASKVVLFKNALFAIFSSFSPDLIAIKYRNPNGKGKHAPSAISFKLEGIIQTYPQCQIELIYPQTIAAFYKKNELGITPTYGYQEDACKIAYFRLKTAT